MVALAVSALLGCLHCHLCGFVCLVCHLQPPMVCNIIFLDWGLGLKCLTPL